jgi:hypothetical protein
MKWLLIVFLLIGQSACINKRYIPAEPSEPATAYLPQVDQSNLSRYTPVFLIEKSDLQYNRIGTPSTFNNDSNELSVFVDPEIPSVYVQELLFKTDNATYKNYVYRIHFEKVPFSLMPFHLTSGKNVGLIVVVTINEENDPVLITTVHTCGCYLGFVPTSFLHEDAFPDGWNFKIQRVYGKRLPGLLDFKVDFQVETNFKIIILVESGSHRIKWIRTEQLKDIEEKYQILPAHIIPMEKLKSLGQNETTTSFFETSGPRKGHVKGSFKPFEIILMSWWAMDLYVGEDKDFGHREETGTIFYTSLKFWDRKKSDMWNFEEFLSYWGWKL